MKNVFLTVIIMASSGLFAQVKVGTNPTVLATNANFQVEGTTTADQFVVLKNGNVGIGNTTLTNRLTVAGFGFNPSVNDLAAIKVEGGYGGGIVFSEGVNRSSIYSNSGSALVFTTGGSASGLPERMRIDATGNLGIGTSVPTQKLDVAGNVKFSGALMPNSVAGTAGQILTSAGANTAPTWQTATAATTPNIYTADGTLTGNRTVTQGANSLNFAGTGVTTFNAGNVGIGTATPTEKLHLFGALNQNIMLESPSGGPTFNLLKVRTYFGMAANTYVGFGGTDDGFLSTRAGIYVPNAANTGVFEAVSILKATGNVGIGTIAPTNKLSVVGIANSMIASFSDGSVITKFFNGTNSSGQTAGFLGTTTFNDFALFTGSQTRLTIQNATGNIGIGTNAPTSLLSLSGANRDIGFYSNGTTINSGKIAIIKSVEIDEGNGHLVFETYRGGFGGGEKMRITNEGNVGIGASLPTSKLQVVGLPIYASNAAATTAGLTAGAFYHNGDGILRVVF